MIQPTSSFFGANRSDALSNQTPKAASALKHDEANRERLSSSNTEALREALTHSPEIRPEVVEKGRRLAVDPNYPPREIILQLAKLMRSSADPSESSS